MKLDTKEFEEKMNKTVDAYRNELTVMRAGRATPDVLNRIRVDYYGAPTPITGVAAVNVSDARTLTITPWDPTIARAIEKAILTSDLGINPQNDGKVIRLSFPPLTEEHRKELAKQISRSGEEARVAIRNIRRDANDEIKKQKKDSFLTEDEQKLAEKAVQDLTDRYIKLIDDITAKKEKEIMKI